MEKRLQWKNIQPVGLSITGYSSTPLAQFWHAGMLRANQNAGQWCRRARDVSEYAMSSGKAGLVPRLCVKNVTVRLKLVGAEHSRIFCILYSRTTCGNGVPQPVQTSSLQQRTAWPSVSVEYISEVSESTARGSALGSVARAKQRLRARAVSSRSTAVAESWELALRVKLLPAS